MHTYILVHFDEIWRRFTAAGTIAATWGLMMVTVWVLKYILPYKTVGRNVANNCYLKLALAHNSNQLGRTIISPRSNIKLF
jgi:hypothetical protein